MLDTFVNVRPLLFLSLTVDDSLVQNPEQFLLGSLSILLLFCPEFRDPDQKWLSACLSMSYFLFGYLEALRTFILSCRLSYVILSIPLSQESALSSRRLLLCFISPAIYNFFDSSVSDRKSFRIIPWSLRFATHLPIFHLYTSLSLLLQVLRFLTCSVCFSIL